MRLDLLINDFTYKALSQGYLVVYESNFMRTFIHVKDMARAFLFAIENQNKMKGEVYNVGNDKMNYSKKDICEIINKKTNAYMHFADVGEDADKRNYIVSYEKINKLGFSTSITVEEGIDELVKALTVVDPKNKYLNA
ncbi:MAG: NAD(P)-dependent oxidoreductase [Candidatus Margulisiibacteriota bacterium]